MSSIVKSVKAKPMNASVDKALEFARAAHAGQVDKGGHPYIKHPIAVAAMVSSEEEKTVALLHDVVEDTSSTLHDLEAAGFSPAVVTAVDAITRRQGESHEAYLSRVQGNPLARAVKIADLAHNMDVSRLKGQPTDRDIARIEKYQYARELLTNKG